MQEIDFEEMVEGGAEAIWSTERKLLCSNEKMIGLWSDVLEVVKEEYREEMKAVIRYLQDNHMPDISELHADGKFLQDYYHQLKTAGREKMCGKTE
jgi:hypothetical protein